MVKANLKGLTLTELILAMAILAFALCGLLNLYVNCILLNETNRNLTLALCHAQYIMEEIRNSDFSGLEYDIINGRWDWNKDDILFNNLAFLRDESIDTNIFQSGIPLGVSVQVNWRDRSGRNRHRQLQTLVTNYR